MMRRFWVLAFLIFIASGCMRAQTDIAPTTRAAALSAIGTYTMYAQPIAVCGQPALPIAQCLRFDITCPGIAMEQVLVSVSALDLLNSAGTDVYMTGGGGGAFFRTYGAETVNRILSPRYNAGYLQAEVAFGPPIPLPPGQHNGWLTGPGGIDALSCRPATILHAIYTELRRAGTSYCGVGQSGGAGAIAGALVNYGAETMLDLAVLTGGPPWGCLDCACLGWAHPGDGETAWAFDCRTNANGTNCLANGNCSACTAGVPGNTLILDGTYGPGVNACAVAATTGQASDLWRSTWCHDSVAPCASDLLDSTDVEYPDTWVHFIFGGRDAGVEPANGKVFYRAITSTGTLSLETVPSAFHDVERDAAGAQAVADAFSQRCIFRH